MWKSQEHQEYQETDDSMELIEKNQQAKVFKEALEKIQHHHYLILH
jgi:adenylate kinase